MINAAAIHFNIGVAGFFDGCEKLPSIATVNALLKEIGKCVVENESRVFDTDEKDIHVDLYACHHFSDTLWTFCHEGGQKNLHIISPGGERVPEAFAKTCASAVTVELDGSSTAVMDMMIAWVTSQIDVAIVAWDGKEASYDGQIWAFVRECKRSHVPCILIDTKDLGKVSWYKHLYFEAYSSERLTEHIDLIYTVPREEKAGREPLLSGWWSRLYAGYMKKHDAMRMDGLARPDGSDAADVLFADADTLDLGNADAKDNYQWMRKTFADFDDGAVKLSERYRSSIYFRSILPILSTVFVAIGFYIETVLGFVTSFSFMEYNVWTILAGIGFLMSAVINIYGYCMSKNKRVQNYREKYVTDRYVAEYMRVATPFLAYGMVLEEASLNEAILDMNSETRAAAIQIRRILRRRTPTDCVLDQRRYRVVLSALSAMLKAQFAYHTRTRARQGAIAEKLKKYAGVVFWLGFALVTARGGLQFVLALIQETEKQNWLVVNGVSTNAFLRSFANMLALVVPAWALYLSAKLNLNNFDGLSKHSGRTSDSLERLLADTDALQAQGTVQYEILCSLAQGILNHQLCEVSAWHAQTSARLVTKL